MSHFKSDSGSSLDACLDEIIASHARASKGSRTRPTHKISPDASLDEIIASHAGASHGSRTRAAHDISPVLVPQHNTPAPTPFRSFVCDPMMDWEPSEEPSTFDMDSLACVLPVEDCSLSMGSLTIGLPEDHSLGVVNSMAVPTHLNQPSPKLQMEGFGGAPFSFQAEWLARHGLPPKPMDNHEWSVAVKALRASRQNNNHHHNSNWRSRSASLAVKKRQSTTTKQSGRQQQQQRPRGHHNRNRRRRGNTSSSPKPAVVGMLGSHKVTKSCPQRS